MVRKADKCENCANSPRWAVYAAYDVNITDIHQIMKRYPAPMYLACNSHLATCMEKDQAVHGSTKQWLIKPII